MDNNALVESGYFPAAVQSVIKKPYASYVDTQRNYEISLIYIAFGLILICVIIEAFLVIWCRTGLLPINWRDQISNITGRLQRQTPTPAARVPPTIQEVVVVASCPEEEIELCPQAQQ